jgi:hypothetical protein
MAEGFLISAVLAAFAALVAYAINKKADEIKPVVDKPKQDVPVTTGVGHSATEIVEAYERATGQELSAIADMGVPIPAPATAAAPAVKPKPKKKKAKAPVAKAAPVEGVAPDGAKAPPSVNT